MIFVTGNLTCAKDTTLLYVLCYIQDIVMILITDIVMIFDTDSVMMLLVTSLVPNTLHYFMFCAIFRTLL